MARTVRLTPELEYAKSGKTRWMMPSRWYRFEFSSSESTDHLIALDSNMTVADGSAMHGVNFTLTPQQQAEQLVWLETELKRPRTTPFLVIMGIILSIPTDPHGDHPVLIRDWDPLFRKYKVDLYLAGHDHDMQHLEFDGHPTSFFLSGGGGADLYDLKIDPSKRGPYGQKIYGFSHLAASSKQLVLRHLDSDAHVLHTFTRTQDGRIIISNS